MSDILIRAGGRLPALPGTYELWRLENWRRRGFSDAFNLRDSIFADDERGEDGRDAYHRGYAEGMLVAGRAEAWYAPEIDYADEGGATS